MPKLPKISQRVKNYGRNVGREIGNLAASEVFKGALTDSLKSVTVQGADDWIANDVNLWEKLDPRHKAGLARLSNFCTNLDWLTVDWVIQAIKEKNLLLASLFLWEDGRSWLDKQIQIIKRMSGF